MPETPKVPNGKGPDPETIIELIDVIDWRWVVFALLVGGAAVFVLLSLIEHTDAGPGDDA